jgi:hypothetical protein
MFPATITRLRGGTKLRDDSVSGLAVMAPQVGESFTLIGEGRDAPATTRLVTTSPVVKMTFAPDDDGFVIETKTGSVYLVQMDGA